MDKVDVGYRKLCVPILLWVRGDVMKNEYLCRTVVLYCTYSYKKEYIIISTWSLIYLWLYDDVLTISRWVMGLVKFPGG